MKINVNIKRIIISLVVITGIFVAGRVIFNSAFPRMVLDGGNLELGAISRQAFGYNNMALLVSNNGLTAVNRRSEVVWSADERFSFPFVSVNGRFILHAGRHNREAAVYRNRRESYRVTTDGNIMLGRVNRNGYSAIATEAAELNGRVTVYNRRGEGVYRWNVGVGYIVDAALSPNNEQLAVAKFISDGTTVASTITFIDIVRDEVSQEVRRDGSLITSIRYNRDGTLVAVSDTELLGFYRDGSLRYEVNFNGRQWTSFNTDSENAVVFAFAAGRGNTAVEIYNRDGRIRGSYLAQGRIDNITVSGDMILVSRQREILRITPAGRAEDVTEVAYDIKSLQVMGDRRHALVVGAAHANVVRL